MKPLVTIICPVYNEQENVPVFYRRLRAVIDPLAEQYDWEILFTNNRSSDNTAAIIRDLHEQDERVQLLTLSRNFGYQASLLCGLTYAGGDASIVIDVDCEDPPEMIPAFLEHWQAGNDIVYGIRAQRPEWVGFHLLRRGFYWLLQRMGDYEVIRDMAEFALVSREARRHMLDNASTFPFLRTEIGYVGFQRVGLPYARQPRLHGKTHYNILGLVLFGVGGILSSSTFLLRLSALVGLLLLPANGILLLLALWNVWAAAFVLLVGLDLMYLVFFLAVASVYLARIYKNGVRRPVFIVDWKRSIYAKRGEPVG